MSVPARRVALDASTLLAWVLRERGADTIDQLLAVSVVPVSAMVEVLYRAGERGHLMAPAQLYADLTAVGVVVEPVVAADAVRAAVLIADSRSAAGTGTGTGTGTLSLGDGLCIAVAERLDLPLAGGDLLWAELTLSVPLLPFR